MTLIVNIFLVVLFGTLRGIQVSKDSGALAALQSAMLFRLACFTLAGVPIAEWQMVQRFGKEIWVYILTSGSSSVNGNHLRVVERSK